MRQARGGRRVGVHMDQASCRPAMSVGTEHNPGAVLLVQSVDIKLLREGQLKLVGGWLAVTLDYVDYPFLTA